MNGFVRCVLSYCLNVVFNRSDTGYTAISYYYYYTKSVGVFNEVILRLLLLY